MDAGRSFKNVKNSMVAELIEMESSWCKVCHLEMFFMEAVISSKAAQD